ncbi:MAG: selenocysteine-specific translation elongation factor [Negativibacillus sp.]
MKNIIIGTAGHVDHGKTALIRALTGIETDRIKEEKKRGITIELGFAYLDLPNGEKAGIIDVPGHEKFVKNMLAGAGGIDLALLVVAADEGFMPQTREHLGILSLLNIPEGLIVVTKKDMVDEDWLEVVCEDIREEVKGTFLESAPILTVSSYTGEGIEDLRQAIFALIDQSSQIKNPNTPFRIPVDRVFSIEGFGTVITGTLIEGQMSVGDPVTIYPKGLQTKIRNLQVHSHDVTTAYAGQRVAVNLAGLKKTDLEKGDVVAQSDSMHTTMMLDVKLSILKNCNRDIFNGTRLHLYHGARDILCKCILMDREVVSAGDEAYAQLRLEEEIAAKTGDRFILRFYSPVETIGGGVILDSNPMKHKRNDPAVLAALNIKDTGSEKEKIEETLKEYSSRYETTAFLKTHTNIDSELFDSIVQVLLEQGQVFPINSNVVIHKAFLQSMEQRAEKLLTRYHEENPLRAGMKRDEFRSKLFPDQDIAVADKVTDYMVKDGVLTTPQGAVALASFAVQFSADQEKLMAQLEKVFLDGGYAVPSLDEVAAQFSKEKAFKQVLESMITAGKLIKLTDQILYHVDVYQQALKLAMDYVAEHGQITLGETRDLLGSSRKYTLALLEYWDRKNITKKVGEARTFTGKL